MVRKRVYAPEPLESDEETKPSPQKNSGRKKAKIDEQMLKFIEEQKAYFAKVDKVTLKVENDLTTCIENPIVSYANADIYEVAKEKGHRPRASNVHLTSDVSTPDHQVKKSRPFFTEILEEQEDTAALIKQATEMVKSQHSQEELSIITHPREYKAYLKYVETMGTDLAVPFEEFLESSNCSALLLDDDSYSSTSTAKNLIPFTLPESFE